MTTFVAKYSNVTTRFQVGTAAVAIAAAATLTPALAHATPNISPFMENIGAGISSLVDPVVYPFAAPATAAASPCASADFSLGCYAVEGFAAGTQAIVRGAVVYVGTAAYVVVAGTGQIFKVLGSFLPGPIGAFFTSVGNGISAFANQIAITFQVGPYQTAQ
jgi:hypothetical protein